jgi:thermitase
MKLPSVQQLAGHLCQPSLLFLGLLGLILLIVTLAGFAAGAEAPMVQAEPQAKPGEILVKFGADVSSLAIETTHQTLGTSVMEVIPQLNVYRLRIPQETTIAEVIELYEHIPGVAYAEPNYFVYALETHPDDGRYGDQWALGAIRAPAAWDITTGTNDIVMAIIDTGIDYTHPDLDVGRYVGGRDFVNQDDDPMDDEGHGTHVTGIATADTNNGQGIAGLAWNSRFMAVKVLDAEGVGTDFDVADGIMYAADQGAHVANLSLGSPFHSHTLENAMQYAYTDGRDGKGMVMACAVGNSYGSGVSYPAAYDQYCLGVAATDHSDERAAFSNYGPEVDVAAPGVDILSTAGGDYEFWSGTSMATPYVTGLAGLILAQDPELSVDQVFAAIRDSADDVNAETHPGEDVYLGTGRINARRALGALVRVDPPDTIADLSSPFTVDVVIEDVTDVGSFRFDVTYDPSVVTVDSVILGDFLGSAGRDVSEVGPDIDNEAGVTSYEAYSSGADPGANGMGVLATINSNAVGLGSSPLQFVEMQVTDTADELSAVGTRDGNVIVIAGCREDFNGDGVINIIDIQLVAARWNTAAGDPGSGYDPFYDINDDGRINIVDIQRVAAKWNTTC